MLQTSTSAALAACNVPTLATPQEVPLPLALVPMAFRSQAGDRLLRAHSALQTHTPCLARRRVLHALAIAHL